MSHPLSKSTIFMCPSPIHLFLRCLLLKCFMRIAKKAERCCCAMDNVRPAAAYEDFQVAVVNSAYSALWTMLALPLGGRIRKWTSLVTVFVTKSEGRRVGVRLT